MRKVVDERSVSGKVSNWSALQVLNRSEVFLNGIKRLAGQFALNLMDASYDFYRYLRYSNSALRYSNDPLKLEPLLFFYYHKIEKSLTLPEIKPVFGLDYIGTTLDLAEEWAHMTGDLDAVVFRGAYAALKSYQDHVTQSISQLPQALVQQLDQFLTKYASPDIDLSSGGTITTSLEPLSTGQIKVFEHIVSQRHSVRNFVDRHIPDNIILHAVKLAQRSPSVCNRQCWRVHVFTSPDDKAVVLEHQNGNKGFGHLADRVILLTADLRSFLTSGERNQASVDSGMYAMTLILALESHGIASCCLNLCLSAREEIAFRRACKISEWEKPIMMIAIGYPPESLIVAVSARKLTESMLIFRNLDQEDTLSN